MVGNCDLQVLRVRLSRDLDNRTGTVARDLCLLLYTVDAFGFPCDDNLIMPCMQIMNYLSLSEGKLKFSSLCID